MICVGGCWGMTLCPGIICMMGDGGLRLDWDCQFTRTGADDDLPRSGSSGSEIKPSCFSRCACDCENVADRRSLACSNDPLTVLRKRRGAPFQVLATPTEGRTDIRHSSCSLGPKSNLRCVDISYLQSHAHHTPRCRGEFTVSLFR